MEAFYVKYNPPDGWIDFREIVLADIREERRKQLEKWGLQVHTPP